MSVAVAWQEALCNKFCSCCCTVFLIQLPIEHEYFVAVFTVRRNGHEPDESLGW